MSTNYDNARSNLDSAMTNGLVEEYDISGNSHKVKRGSLQGQIDALTKLEGLVARRASGGLLKLAKFKEPSD